MSPKSRVPNLVELGRRPDPVRYFWVARTDNDLFGGAGYRRLMSILAKYPETTLLLTDIVDNEVVPVTNKEQFMAEWRANYFDIDWKYDPAQEVQA